MFSPLGLLKIVLAVILIVAAAVVGGFYGERFGRWVLSKLLGIEDGIRSWKTKGSLRDRYRAWRDRRAREKEQKEIEDRVAARAEVVEDFETLRRVSDAIRRRDEAVRCG